MIETDTLTLVLVAVAVVLVALLLTLKVGGRTPWLTAAAIGLLAMAAVGFRIPSGDRGRSVALVDVSWSMGESAPTPSAGRGEATRTIVFGRRAVVAADPDPSIEVRAAAGEDGSDLAGALRVAAEHVGPGGRVTVVTDGRVAAEGLAAAAAAVRARGASIRVVPGGRRRAADARVTSLRLPGGVSAEATVTALAAVEGPPGSTLVVRLFVGGREAARRDVPLGVSGRAGVRFDVRPPGPGRHEIEVAVVPPSGDPCPVNDRRSAGLVVTGARRVGLRNAEGLRPVLLAGGWEVVDDVSADLGTLDLLVVRDVTIADFGDRGESVRRYVESGGGLLIAGGTSCFGPGGWGGSPLEECLPVLSHPGEEGLFVAVLLDRSGTMADPFRPGGRPKFDAARRATEALVSVLPDGADLLLVPFAGTILSEPRLLPITDAASRAAARNRLADAGRPSGGTELVGPLDRAREALREVEAEKRLVLLFTDGRLEGESPASVGVAAAALRNAGARIVCFAVGEDADRALLDGLGGPGTSAVPVTEAGQVRDGFLHALFALQGQDRIVAGPRPVTATGAPGLPVIRVPAVSDVVRTWPRPGATSWHVTEDDAPVTAGGRYGLGRAVVATADLAGLPGALAAALMEAAARPAALGAARLEVRTERGRRRLRATLALGTASVSGWIRDAAGARSPVTLVATGPDTFEADLLVAAPGAAWVDLGAAGGPPVRAGMSVPWSEEYLASGPDEVAIADLVGRLGGDPSEERGGSGDAAPFLAGLALLLFLADRLKLSRAGVR